MAIGTGGGDVGVQNAGVGLDDDETSLILANQVLHMETHQESYLLETNGLPSFLFFFPLNI